METVFIGLNGKNGSSRKLGGGASGGVYREYSYNLRSGSGATATSYSGGSGGAGSDIRSSGENAYGNGGTGGSVTYGDICNAGGGARQSGRLWSC